MSLGLPVLLSCQPGWEAFIEAARQHLERTGDCPTTFDRVPPVRGGGSAAGSVVELSENVVVRAAWYNEIASSSAPQTRASFSLWQEDDGAARCWSEEHGDPGRDEVTIYADSAVDERCPPPALLAADIYVRTWENPSSHGGSGHAYGFICLDSFAAADPDEVGPAMWSGSVFAHLDETEDEEAHDWLYAFDDVPCALGYPEQYCDDIDNDFDGLVDEEVAVDASGQKLCPE